MKPQPFFFALPPRDVPWSVRCKVIFGGFSSQFGWADLGIGMIFVWIFLPVADLTSWHRFRGDVESAEGRVVAVEKTHYSVGGSKHRKGTPVYQYQYEFSVGGQRFAGVSYTTGRRFSENASVTIEYPRGNASVSRIQGARRTPLGLWASFVVVFPLVGAVFIFNGLVRGFRANRLLANGQVALGTLKSKEPTRTKVNNSPVYKLTFDFVADDGQTYQAIARTHKTHLLEDNAQEQLVYDPLQPSHAVLVDSLPGTPHVNETGVIQPASLLSTLPLFILPILAITANAAFLYWKMTL